MEFYSTNPYNGEQVGKYKTKTEEETIEVLNNSGKAFKEWKKTSLSYRTDL